LVVRREPPARPSAGIKTLRHPGIPAERTRPFLGCLTAGHQHADDCPASLAGYRQVLAWLRART
jgi:hypothetical protein